MCTYSPSISEPRNQWFSDKYVRFSINVIECVLCKNERTTDNKTNTWRSYLLTIMYDK